MLSQQEYFHIHKQE